MIVSLICFNQMEACTLVRRCSECTKFLLKCCILNTCIYAYDFKLSVNQSLDGVCAIVTRNQSRRSIYIAMQFELRRRISCTDSAAEAQL